MMKFLKLSLNNFMPFYGDYHEITFPTDSHQNILLIHGSNTYGKTSILRSIKCLDEGIDIPSISHAIILASSQNPRQFIQRRGRVLRVFGSKKSHANIYDALITPTDIEDEPDQISLLKSEIQRAFEFATYALNPSSANELKLKLIDLGVNLSDIIDTGFEEEEELK